MRAFLIAGMLAGAILTAPGASAHDRDSVQLERMIIHEHCVRCCSGLELDDTFEMREQDCHTACDFFTRELIKLRMGL